MINVLRFIFSFLLIFLSGCAVEPSERSACCGYGEGVPAGSPEHKAESVYCSNGVWQCDNGQELSLRSLAGRPRVIGMVYTTCAGTCGVTLNHMQQIEASVQKPLSDRVGFVIVTLDPAHDSAAALSRYRAAHQLSRDRWTLLRGTSGGTAALARALGVRYAKDPVRGIIHTSRILVLDSAGNIINAQEGARADLNAIIEALKTADSPPALSPTK